MAFFPLKIIITKVRVGQDIQFSSKIWITALMKRISSWFNCICENCFSVKLFQWNLRCKRYASPYSIKWTTDALWVSNLIMRITCRYYIPVSIWWRRAVVLFKYFLFLSKIGKIYFLFFSVRLFIFLIYFIKVKKGLIRWKIFLSLANLSSPYSNNGKYNSCYLFRFLVINIVKSSPISDQRALNFSAEVIPW